MSSTTERPIGIVPISVEHMPGCRCVDYFSPDIWGERDADATAVMADERRWSRGGRELHLDAGVESALLNAVQSAAPRARPSCDTPRPDGTSEASRSDRGWRAGPARWSSTGCALR